MTGAVKRRHKPADYAACQHMTVDDCALHLGVTRGTVLDMVRRHGFRFCPPVPRHPKVVRDLVERIEPHLYRLLPDDEAVALAAALDRNLPLDEALATVRPDPAVTL